METVKKIRTAKVDHVCGKCEQIIYSGGSYFVLTTSPNGYPKFYNPTKFCTECFSNMVVTLPGWARHYIRTLEQEVRRSLTPRGGK